MKLTLARDAATGYHERIERVGASNGAWGTDR
jgi:predicted nucleic acid-binding protein